MNMNYQTCKFVPASELESFAEGEFMSKVANTEFCFGSNNRSLVSGSVLIQALGLVESDSLYAPLAQLEKDGVYVDLEN